MLQADDFDSRVAVLQDRRAEVVADCGSVLDDVDRRVGVKNDLAREALTAFAGGYPAAGHALAVVVTDSAVHSVFAGSSRSIATQVSHDLGDLPMQVLRLFAALAPLARFYTEWWPGQDPLAYLSRHVSAHYATAGQQYSEVNALVAVMLTTSVLRALIEAEEIGSSSRG